MWIVRLALRRPYTFPVMAIFIVILAGYMIFKVMPTDIFPEVDIPVIAVNFRYDGMPPQEIADRITTVFERTATTAVSDIEHTESLSLQGEAIVKVFFQPGAKIDLAMSQVTAASQAMLRTMPPGMTPPFILVYSASDVPIVQLSLSSDTLSEQELFDDGANFLRGGLVTVPGAEIPWPYGGKQRTIMVDLQPDKLYAWGLAPQDISNAVAAQNLIIPAGLAKIGPQEYPVRINSSPETVAALNDLPVKTVNGTTVYLRDVAHVRDGFVPQHSMVHVDGKRGALLSVYKSGKASTLDVVKQIREHLPAVLATLPKEFKVTPIFDQSLFVRASVVGVVMEASIAAMLTALMILLFLGSLRSTIIVCISIPLSVAVSIIILGFLGETLNVMTLGGMALAVGILVDDATVEIENIHRNLHQGKRLVQAILDGAQQIAVPAFVSTLCICIVFVPVVFLTGAARSLFTPLAMAVVFAMLTSYLLSRTLIPTMVHHMLAGEVKLFGGRDEDEDHPHGKNLFIRALEAIEHPIWKLHQGFNRQFERLRRVYGGLLAMALEHRVSVVTAFAVFVIASCGLYPLIGRDFFPTVDAGLIRLHVRGRPGTRIEQSERNFGRVEDLIRRDIPASEIESVSDNIGVPYSSINMALSDGSLMSSADGEILVSLKEHHQPTAQYVQKLRADLKKQFPELVTFFQPADIVTQVLNFGLPAPIDVQIDGPNQNTRTNLKIANAMLREMEKIPGIGDVRMMQVPNVPDLYVQVDRTMASQLGLAQQDVASSLLISLSSTAVAQPMYWINPVNGNQYNLAVQTPDYRIDSLESLQNTPVQAPGRSTPQLLSNVAQISRTHQAANVTHYDVMPVFDINADHLPGADLGSVEEHVRQVVEQFRPQLPRGSSIRIRGQAESMDSSFRNMALGLIAAVILVYLLMVVNFQSWLDPLIILMALPGALAGILWMLFVTQTTISVPALMGAIMSIGVATANSILMITFANDRRRDGRNAHDAALEAGMTRLRPVIMTALAMIIGMLPMSLGAGEGGEQNAPLARAVIGGLTLATFATLFFVPLVYSALRHQPPHKPVEKELQ
jgi:multidrug efflux pump subunit AcrB